MKWGQGHESDPAIFTLSGEQLPSWLLVLLFRKRKENSGLIHSQGICASSKCPSLHHKGMWQCDSHHLGWVRFSPDRCRMNLVSSSKRRIVSKGGMCCQVQILFCKHSFSITLCTVSSHINPHVQPLSVVMHGTPGWQRLKYAEAAWNSSRGKRMKLFYPPT